MAGMLLDTNCDEYNKTVRREAESLYRSRHFTELNKARTTIEKSAYNTGLSTGHEKGKAENRIWFYCSVCGKPVYIEPNTDVHKAVIKYMHEHRWAHSSCLAKQS